MAQVLLVARTPEVRDQLKQVAKDCGVDARVAEDFDPARAEIEKEPPMLVFAEDPPDDDTMEKLQKTLQVHAPVTPLLLYLKERDGAQALKRMMSGAYDCLCPPLTPGDFLAAGRRSVSRVGRRLLASRKLHPAVWWRQPATFVSLGAVLFLTLLGLGLFGLWTPPFQIYKLATDHPVGVAGDNNDLWVADWSQQNLTGMRPQGDYVAILEVHKLKDFQPLAVAMAPFYVYTASADGRLRRHRKDDPQAVVASLAAPAASPSGLAWDGESLWSCDSETGKIYQHDAQLGVKTSFTSPAEKPVGLAWRGKSLWVADGRNPVLWKMTPEGAEWKKEGPFPLEVFAHNRGLSMSGFTIWKERAWIVSEEGGVLVKHRLPEGGMK